MLPMFSLCVFSSASGPFFFYLGLRPLSQFRQPSMQAHFLLPGRLIAAARPHLSVFTLVDACQRFLFSFYFDADASVIPFLFFVPNRDCVVDLPFIHPGADSPVGIEVFPGASGADSEFPTVVIEVFCLNPVLSINCRPVFYNPGYKFLGVYKGGLLCERLPFCQFIQSINVHLCFAENVQDHGDPFVWRCRQDLCDLDCDLDVQRLGSDFRCHCSFLLQTDFCATSARYGSPPLSSSLYMVAEWTPIMRAISSTVLPWAYSASIFFLSSNFNRL